MSKPKKQPKDCWCAYVWRDGILLKHEVCSRCKTRLAVENERANCAQVARRYLNDLVGTKIEPVDAEAIFAVIMKREEE